MLFRAEGRENMIADRARPRGSLPFMDRRATLFYFAAAVPAVGFVHGPADVNPLDEAMLDSDPERCFPWQAERAGRVTPGVGGCRWLRRHGGGSPQVRHDTARVHRAR